MDKNTIFKKINMIFQDVFDDETLCISETTSAKDIEDWDSIAHITIIAMIEKEFKMKFSMDEVAHAQNVGELAAIVEERINH